MLRATSIAVYNQLAAAGVLSRLRLLVLGDIANNGPTTQSEAWQRLRHGLFKDSVGPRFAELEAMGLICVVSSRPCLVTGQECVTWDLTGSTTPIPLKARTTRVEQERQACYDIARKAADDALDDTYRAAARDIADEIMKRGRKP